MTATADSLGRASASGAVWNGATLALSKLVVLVTTIVLARLLVPDDFGLVAIGLVLIGYLDFVNDFGVSAAVIQRRGGTDHRASVAFWLNLMIGVTLTLLGIAVAPLLADVFNEPRATPIVRVLSASFLITSVGAIHEARLRRELEFKRRVVPELAKGLVKGAVSITLAVAGLGAWSLVWGQLAGALTGSLLYWLAFRWRPSPTFDLATVRDLISFGAPMTLVGLLGGLHKNVDYLLVGRRLGTRDLGLYTIAFRMPQLLIESVVSVTGQVAFPAFAQVQGDHDKLRRGLRRMLELTALVIVPLGLGLALVADPFVRVLYGERWTAAIPVMELLALYMLVQSLTKTCGDLYKAIGRPGILNWLAVVKLGVTVPLLLIAVPHGIVAVAVAQLVSAAVLSIVKLVLSARIVGVTLVRLLRAFVPAMRAGAVMSALCAVTRIVVDRTPPLAELTTVTLVGAAAYLGMLLTFDRALVVDAARLFRRSSSRRRATLDGDPAHRSSPDHASPDHARSSPCDESTPSPSASALPSGAGRNRSPHS